MVPMPVAAVLEPAPDAFAVAALPACAAADLSLSFDGENGAFDGLQKSGTLMVVRNIGPKPCRVTALPGVAFAGPDGAALPVRMRPPAGMHPGPAVPPVGIAPGAEITAELRWTSGDAFAGGRCHAAARVRVSFGDVDLQTPLATRFCGPATGATFLQAWLKADAGLKP